MAKILLLNVYMNKLVHEALELIAYMCSLGSDEPAQRCTTICTIFILVHKVFINMDVWLKY